MATATTNPSNKDHHFEKAKEAGAQVLDKAKEAGQEMGTEVLDRVKCAIQSVGKEADDLTGAAGHEIKAFGDSLGQKAPHEGITGHASQAVADTIKGAGKYVEDAKLSGMAHDVEQMIKTHPIPAALICLGVGFFVGRAMKD